MATGYLTLNDHVVTEKLLLHFRGVIQLACIKHRIQLRRMIKTSEEETLISEAQWKKKRLVFAMGHKDRTKVTWSDESRFVFFQNDQWIRQIKWCIHMHLLYKPVGATLMIRGSFTWPDPGSVNMPPKNWGHLTTWIHWMTRTFYQLIIFLLWWHMHISKWHARVSWAQTVQVSLLFLTWI